MNNGSVWQALREQHEEVSGERDPLYLDDPVHDGVVYRYKYVPAENLTSSMKRLKKIRNPIDQQVGSAIETLLASLDEIMVINPDGTIPAGRDGKPLYPQPLIPLADEGEPPIRFDEALCEGMGFSANTAKSAHRIVRAMFVGNSYLIIEHSQEVAEWCASTGETVRTELAEEIEGNA